MVFGQAFFRRELASSQTKHRTMMYKRHLAFYMNRKRAGAAGYKGGGGGGGAGAQEVRHHKACKDISFEGFLGEN